MGYSLQEDKNGDEGVAEGCGRGGVVLWLRRSPWLWRGIAWAKDDVEEERLDERIPQAAMLEPGLGLHIACTGR